LRDQRGHYRDALRLALEGSPSGVVTISSDHDFRNGLLVAYHAGKVPSGERLRYVARARAAKGSPDWFVRHSLTDGPAPPRTFREPGGTRFFYAAHFPATPPSGVHWYLYRRLDRATAKAAAVKRPVENPVLPAN
jgi:hypothetical protein